MAIAILIPSMGTWRAEFGMSLADLTARTPAYLIHSECTLLPQSRTELVEAALKTDAEQFLWCDVDMVFGPETYSRLNAHGEDIVGCSYSTRRAPFKTTASVNGARLGPSCERVGIEAVDVLGMGLVLTHRRIFETVPKPWFTTGWLQDEKGELLSVVSEDAYFFKKCKQQGFQPYIDHNLSKEVGHVGTAIYTHEALMAHDSK